MRELIARRKDIAVSNNRVVTEEQHLPLLNRRIAHSYPPIRHGGYDCLNSAASDMLRPQACSFTSTRHTFQSQQRASRLSCVCWASQLNLAATQNPTCLRKADKGPAFGKSFWQQTGCNQALRSVGQPPGRCQRPGWTLLTPNAGSRRRLCAKASQNGSEGKHEDPRVAKLLQPGPINGSPSILRDQNGIPIDGIQGGKQGGNGATLEKYGPAAPPACFGVIGSA